MPRISLEGVVGALLTPFTETREVDFDVWSDEITFVAEHADVVAVLAAEVSEYRSLTPAQRRHALRYGVELAAGRRPVLAGASSSSLAEVVELSEIAAEAGADAVQVLMPRRTWGGEPAPGDLVAYMDEVARESALPVVAYHNPGFGADPSLATIVAITELDRVVAIKDSSRNVSRILQAIELIERPGHARYLGTIQPLLTILLQGGAGAMMPPPATLVGAAVVAAFRAGDVHHAAELQNAVAIFPAAWSHHGLTPVMKAALASLGIPVGNPAAPQAPVDSADAEAIGAIVAAWPGIAVS
jgi:4-hydroxy-tetrahydrodipicolinate synthase